MTTQPYKPKRPKGREYRLLDRHRPFELFLKFGGGIYTVHFQFCRLVILLESKARKR